MNDLDIFIKLTSLPKEKKREVEDFIDFLKLKTKQKNTPIIRKGGLAKGLITIKDGFDDPIEDFKDYM